MNWVSTVFDEAQSNKKEQMDDDLLELLRNRIKESRFPKFRAISPDNIEISSELLDRFASESSPESETAASNIAAALKSDQKLDEGILKSITGSLRLQMKMPSTHLTNHHLEIALNLVEAGYLTKPELEELVNLMKGNDDFSILSESRRLLALIGPAFIQEYLTSDKLFETGGMGGPMKPLLKEMALTAIQAHHPH